MQRDSRAFPSSTHVELSINGAARLAGTVPESQYPSKGLHWVTDVNAEIPIKLRENGPGSERPITIMQQFRLCLEHHATKPALHVKRKGHWQSLTWQKYYDDCVQFARSCVALNLPARSGVAILGFNSPEWLISNFGAIFANLVPAGIYTTNGPDACHYIAHHCDASLVVVENQEQLSKFLEIRDRLPSLRAMVVYDDEVPAGLHAVYSWSQFLALGGQPQPDKQSTRQPSGAAASSSASGDPDMAAFSRAVQARMVAQSPGTCCSLIYTSGTTGNPKAVMLSHDNITWTAKQTLQQIPDANANDSMVSYLPLSHIAAQMTDMHVPMVTGHQTYFAMPDALKGSLVNTLREVRPTVMFGVPRVWEKIEERLRAIGAEATGLKKSISAWAKQVGLEGGKALLSQQSPPLSYSVANTLIFNQIRSALGIDRARLLGTGAAPISRTTLDYFLSLGMPIYELYGMSESTGPQTFNSPGAIKMGTVGRSMPGTDLILDNPDVKGNGEICYRGRNMFMGYLKNDAATAETIDDNGFLHSGDVGIMDDAGYISITGRIKELLITAGGENIPPVLIEDNIKQELPILANVMVIGDRRPFLAAFLTLKTEPDANGHATERLAAPVLAVAQSVGSKAKTVAEARSCPKLRQAIEEGIHRFNEKRSISRAQNIRKWEILPRDFSVEGGELTATMKLKRKVVLEKYATLVEHLYAEKLPSKL